MKMMGAPTFQEFPSSGVFGESKTGSLKRVSVIVENDTSVGRDKPPLIHNTEVTPPLVNTSEGEDPRGKWEKVVKETLAQSGIGRQYETAKRNDEALVMDNQKQVSSAGSRAQEQPGNLRDLAEVVRDNIQDPDIWMTHTKAARVALAANDLDTAIREIKLAIAVAPEKLKTWLDDFLAQLENDRRRLPEANHGEIHREEVAESPKEVAESLSAKPEVRVNVMGLHPILGRLVGPQDDACKSDK